MRTYKNDVSAIDGFTGGLAETAPEDGMVSYCYILEFVLDILGGTTLCLHHQEAV